MSNLKTEFYNIIKLNKPNISESSIEMYSNCIKTFYLQNTKYKTINKKWFLNHNKILELIKDKSNRTQNIIIYAIQAFLGKENLIEYKNKGVELENQYDEEMKKNEKSESQKENWKSHSEIINTYEIYLNNNKHLFKQEKLNEFETQILQNIIILAVTCGTYFQVRRVKDWIEIKIDGEISTNADNYIDEDEQGIILIFNDYKTAKSKGKQTINIKKDTELYNLLTEYIAIKQELKCLYLFTDKNNKKLSNVTFNQRLNKLYGGHIGSSLIRHIQATDKINKDIKDNNFSLERIEKDADGQGHSLITHLKYYKN